MSLQSDAAPSSDLEELEALLLDLNNSDTALR